MCLLNKCLAPGCFDGVKNGDEGDKDCGGSCPLKCLDGASCNMPGDCLSAACPANKCLPSSCYDSKQSSGETDVDCGGICTPGIGCAVTKGCIGDNDCASSVCMGDTCFAVGSDVPAPKGGGPPPNECPMLTGQMASYKAANGHCFYWFSTKVTWGQAWAACDAVGAHLATFDTKAEADEVQGQLGSGDIWIGAYCLDGKDCANRARWRWLGDLPITFDDWENAGVPNSPFTERCLRINGGDKLDNQVCKNGYTFLCELGD